MKKQTMIAAFALAMAFSIPVKSYAQRPNAVTERWMLDRALTVIEDYETLATVSDEDVYYSFLDLFTDENAPVYNDLLGISTEKELPLSTYLKRLREDSKNAQINISNIRKDKVWYEDGWKIQFSFDKTISYSTNCGIYFSNNDFFGKVYRLEAVMAYNEDAQECRIERITGAEDAPTMPGTWYVFERTSPKDDKLIYTRPDGKKGTMNFNSREQAILVGEVDAHSAFRYPDPDIRTVPMVDENCHIITMNYKVARWRIRPHFDLPVGEYYAVSSDANNIETKSSGMEFGLDLGYSFPSNGKVKTSVNVGLSYATSSIDLSLKEQDYNLENYGPDEDGDRYTRQYSGVRASEKLKAGFLCIPVYIDFDFRLSGFLSLYADLGVKPYLNLSSSSDYSLKVDEIKGFYPEYDLTLDHTWRNPGADRAFAGFCQNITQNDVLLNNPKPQVNSFALDVFGGAGFRLHPVNSIPLFVDLGVSYQRSLTDAWKYSQSNSYSLSASDKFLLWYDGNEHAHLLSDAITSAKRSHLKINIGITYKF